MSTVVEVTRGSGPVVLGLPHTGTRLETDIAAKLNKRGLELADTDWHIHELYEGLLPGATTVRATFHRYVIDANRDPEGVSLYPGQNTTGLVPLTDFDGEDIWDVPPTDDDVAYRLNRYHRPYHQALEAEMRRVHETHGIAILYDCHSIRSHIPFLFDGKLPDFNIGTNLGATCAAQIEQKVAQICQSAAGYTSVLNGRFKGGWTTRHYGRPLEGWHAIQMELAQSTHIHPEAAPWDLDADLASKLRQPLGEILTALAELAPTLGGKA